MIVAIDLDNQDYYVTGTTTMRTPLANNGECYTLPPFEVRCRQAERFVPKSDSFMLIAAYTMGSNDLVGLVMSTRHK